MDEVLKMYSEFATYIQNVDNMESVIKADATLSNLENAYPELIAGAGKYSKCFACDKNAGFNVCVLGADGHGIAHALRNEFPNASVIWIPNAGLLNDNFHHKFNGLVLSNKILNECFIAEKGVFAFTEAVGDGAFLMFDAKDVDRRIVIDVLNRNKVVLNKWYDDGVISSLFMQPVDPVIDEADKVIKCRYNKVYCLCPAFIKTGGPELLHQLVFHINKYGGDAEIAYVNTKEAGGYTNPEFAGYVSGKIGDFSEIEDVEGNAVVIPEGWPMMVEKVYKADVLFWWLSVDNFTVLEDDERILHKTLEMIKKRASSHLIQSEYARQYLLSNGVGEDEIEYLSDYINDAYLEEAKSIETVPKQDIVLYNPKKGKEFVGELIKTAPDIGWTAIENMTTTQVRDLMRRAKVYIDFGNHPGKDRIPREAAMSRCIVITGRKGSAAYKEDVPIPDIYKIDEVNASYERIIKLIRDCIDDYSDKINDFEDYRSFISAEKKKFSEDVKKVFF